MNSNLLPQAFRSSNAPICFINFSIKSHQDIFVSCTINIFKQLTLFIFPLRVRLGSAFCASQTHVYVSQFFFFFFLSSSNFLTFLVLTVLLCTVHGSHKIHFSATFSLKIGPTILFTHLKIILLQCFSVFSFSFQFSAVSKRTLRQVICNPLILFFFFLIQI